jgi:hypothetical protein
MSTRRIDELVWLAFTDSMFRERLLDGHRRDMVAASNLTDAERRAVLAVSANSLEAFAASLCQPALCMG